MANICILDKAPFFKKILSLWLLVGLCSPVCSQEGSSTKITVFQPGGVKQEDVPKPPPLTNLVKWNYSVTTRGVFLMNYEFVMTERLTCEVGAGLTYRDFIYEATQNSMLLEYRNPNVNFAVEGGFRLYPKKHIQFEGIYLSPVVSFRKYSFDPQKELYGGGNYAGYDPSFSPGYSFLDAQFKFGYQYESWWIDDVTTDFYIGFCLRNATAKYYELYELNTFFGSSTEIRPVTEADSYPQPLFGFKLGLAF